MLTGLSPLRHKYSYYLCGNVQGIICAATRSVLSIRQLSGYYLSSNSQVIIYPAMCRVLSIRHPAMRRVLSIRQHSRCYLSGNVQGIMHRSSIIRQCVLVICQALCRVLIIYWGSCRVLFFRQSIDHQLSYKVQVVDSPKL